MGVKVDIYIRSKQPLLPPSKGPGYHIPIQRYIFPPLTSSYRSHVLQTSDRVMQRTTHPSSFLTHPYVIPKSTSPASRVWYNIQRAQAFFIAATALAIVSPIALELK